SKLRGYFRKRNKQENASRGKEAIEKELRSQGLDPREFIGEDKLNNVLKTIPDCETVTDLLAKVGEGLMTVQAMVQKLRGLTPQQPSSDSPIHTTKSREADVMLVAGGVDNVMLRRGKCCEPLPGEDVIGYVTRGKGIVIHRKLCSNVIAFEQSEPERLTALAWPSDGKVYSGQLKIQVVNRQGLLMDIITVFGESKTNVVGANIRTLPNGTAEIYVTLDVRDIEHLNYLMTKISHFSDVISILRIYGRPGASK
ncbi:MAG: bifunctional (p)ppGpp synthetase/guanosine-3',5'-bis(diphosphate) 3'-pyrophosphohydrolase, partial [Chthonomonas sp.]|nr:bifunctional (p)ppGpp synthetase/guanosine-3',5'-bis(diphosphate) 3'-pyrophosphohydrolase [Chthonomonas sp.]